MHPAAAPQSPALPALPAPPTSTGPTPLDPRQLGQVAGGGPTVPPPGVGTNGWRWA